MQNREEMAQFLQETIDDHRKSFDPSHLRDLLDTYLYEIQKADEVGNGHNLFEGKNHGKFLLYTSFSCTRVRVRVEQFPPSLSKILLLVI